MNRCNVQDNIFIASVNGRLHTIFPDVVVLKTWQDSDFIQQSHMDLQTGSRYLQDCSWKSWSRPSSHCHKTIRRASSYYLCCPRSCQLGSAETNWQVTEFFMKGTDHQVSVFKFCSGFEVTSTSVKGQDLLLKHRRQQRQVDDSSKVPNLPLRDLSAP